jgi:hypothetical protein
MLTRHVLALTREGLGDEAAIKEEGRVLEVKTVIDIVLKFSNGELKKRLT